MIEKLDPQSKFRKRDHLIVDPEYDVWIETYKKINEIIDSFNQFNKEQDLLIDMVTGDHKKRTENMLQIIDRLNKLENAIHPKEEEILNCLWCNNKPEVASGCEADDYVIQCRNINCHVRPQMHMDCYKTKQEAIAAWNSRK